MGCLHVQVALGLTSACLRKNSYITSRQHRYPEKPQPTHWEAGNCFSDYLHTHPGGPKIYRKMLQGFGFTVSKCCRLNPWIPSQQQNLHTLSLNPKIKNWVKRRPACNRHLPGHHEPKARKASRHNGASCECGLLDLLEHLGFRGSGGGT